ncbi:MAG: phosphotransferase [Bacteroidales bacterium]|nr:phosphotransferase [Bacteroidales bacterium]
MKRIDINDWNENGGGYFGKSYFHKTDSTLLLKMMTEGFPSDVREEECRLAHIVYGMGIPTPRPGDLVTDGSRFGMIYERMPEKLSFAKAVGLYPERIPELALMFASMVKQLHSTPCSPECPPVKKLWADCIRQNTFRSEAMKSRAIDMLYSIPDADTCLHGDLHFGNAILSRGKGYFIDLGGFCSGYPLLDMGMMMGILHFGKAFPDFFFNSYHCTVEQGTEFWHCFLKSYFGPDVDIDAKEKDLMPCLALRQISVEPSMGKPLPDEDCAEPFKLFE